MSQPHDELTEQVLVRQAQRGSHDAFGLLVERYDRRLLYYVRRLLGDGDESFDVLQAAWLQVFRKLSSLKSPQAFRVWLYRIVHDQAVSHLRRERRQPPSVGEDAIESIAVEQPMADELLANVELVHLALRDIKWEYREVLTLRYLEDLAVDEISVVTDLPEGTVKSRLYYARIALKTRIEELGNG